MGFGPKLNVLRTLLHPFNAGRMGHGFATLLSSFYPSVIRLGGVRSRLSPIVTRVTRRGKVGMV